MMMNDEGMTQYVSDTSTNHCFSLSQEIKHFKQMCGDEAGAAEIKTEGEC